MRRTGSARPSLPDRHAGRRPAPRATRLGLEVRLERVTFHDARPDAWQSLLLATLSRPT